MQPGTATAMTPEDLGLLPPAPDCPEQQPDEPQLEYAGRVLAYALNYGPAPLTLTQLATADARAVEMIAGLPQKVDAYAYTSLDQDGARLYETLHQLRARIATRTAEKRAQLASLQRLMDAAEQEAAAAQEAAQEETPESDQDRALRLLRAALILIMQPGQDGGGGRPARLQRPVPSQPGPRGGNHADDPSTAAAVTRTEAQLRTPDDGIAF